MSKNCEYADFRKLRENRRELGVMPFHRDDPWLAFGNALADLSSGQVLAGTGALVFEGELLKNDRPFNRAN